MSRAFVLVVLVGLVLRIGLATLGPTYDVVQLERSAAIFAHGGNIFVEQYYFNYSPAILGPLLAALHETPIPFPFAWRAFLTGISLGNACLVSARSGRRWPIIFMLWWLNPALILFDGYAGQFEGLSLLPLLLVVRYAS